MVHWTFDDIPDQTGRIAVVTGANTGIGFETARMLAQKGARVVLACRTPEKGEAAALRIAATRPVGSATFAPLDLSDLDSVAAFASAIAAAHPRLDLLVNNAGVMVPPLSRTKQGFELQFGTNHLGHFVLVNRCAPLMGAGARLVNLASSGHRFSNVDLDDPNFAQTPYDPFVAYGRSKTANILFARAFDERHRSRGVRATAVHPGGIQTELGRHMDDSQLDGMIEKMNEQLAAEGKAPFQWKTIPQGAATSVWAGVVAPAEAVGGRYCENCHVGEIVADDVVISAISEGVRGYALDLANALALWEKSEEMVGESFPA